MQEQRDYFNDMSAKDSVGFAYMLAFVLSANVSPILRSGQGVRAFQWCGPFALLFMFFYSGFMNCPELLYLLPPWLLLVFVRRIRADREMPSRHMGYPYIFRWFGEQAYFAEGLFWLGVGYLLLPITEPFGVLLMLSGGAILFVEMIDRWSMRARILDMEDAAKIQRGLTSRMRR